MPFIYALLDPRTNEVRYVGKAADIAKRLQTHMKDARRTNTLKNAWLRSLKRQGLRPGVTVLEEVGLLEWGEAERRWIAQFRATSVQLLNMADGGEGRTGPLTAAARENVGKAIRSSARFREAMRQAGLAKRGRPGHPVSAEARAKIGVANRGRRHTLVARQLMSVAQRGKRKTMAHRGHIAAALRGRVFSMETRTRMSEAKRDWKPPASLVAVVKERNRGAGNGRAKLSADDVIAIRTRYLPYVVSLSLLAREYGVSISAIHAIVKGKTWLPEASSV